MFILTLAVDYVFFTAKGNGFVKISSFVSPSNRSDSNHTVQSTQPFRPIYQVLYGILTIAEAVGICFFHYNFQ